MQILIRNLREILTYNRLYFFRNLKILSVYLLGMIKWTQLKWTQLKWTQEFESMGDFITFLSSVFQGALCGLKWKQYLSEIIVMFYFKYSSLMNFLFLF